jgi:hypothetical protein
MSANAHVSGGSARSRSFSFSCDIISFIGAVLSIYV